MDWILTGAFAVAGYLIGSISFARLLARIVIPGKDISKVEHPVPGTDMVFTMDAVSATTMRTHGGTKYGCLTAVLDMLKAALPMLVVRSLHDGMPYHLAFGAAVVAGHNWPIYHGFKGGRGESPIIGGYAVIDWLGLLATSVLGAVGGLVFGSLLVMRWAWMFLMIPWLWWRTDELWHVGYAFIVTCLYFLALVPELSQYVRLKRGETPPSQEAVADFLAMGKGVGRLMDRYSLFALYHRFRNRGSAQRSAR